jgi:hypothetical protein
LSTPISFPFHELHTCEHIDRRKRRIKNDTPIPDLVEIWKTEEGVEVSLLEKSICRELSQGMSHPWSLW